MANQVATGLALSLFGVGLSAFVGLDYVSVVIDGSKPLAIPGLSDLPVVGKLLFAHNPLVYLSLAAVRGGAAGSSTTRAPGSSCARSANRRSRRTRSAIP